MQPSTILIRYRSLLWALVIGGTLLAFGGISRLGFQDNPREILRSGNANDARFNQLLQHSESFGSSENECVVLVEANNILDASVLHTVHDLQDSIRKLSSVDVVYSLFDIRRQKGLGRMLPKLFQAEMTNQQIQRLMPTIQRHPLIVNRLLSEDHSATLINVRPRDSEMSMDQLQAFVNQLQTTVDAVNRSDEIQVTLTGLPFVRLSVIKNLQREQISITLWAMGLTCVVAWLLFRNLRDLIAVMIAPTLGMIWSLGFLGGIGGTIDVLNIVMSPLVLVVGFTDSVHLMFEIRRQQRRGLAGGEAVLAALKTLGPACVQTSLTTAIGFGSLAMVDSAAMQTFGLCCAMGAVFVLVSVVSVVPLISWGRIAAMPDCNDDRAATTTAGPLETFVARFPKLITAAGVTAAIALSCVAMTAKPDYRFSENLPTSSDTLRTLQKLDDQFGGAFPLEVVVTWPADAELSDQEVIRAIVAVEQQLSQHQELASPTSVRTVLASLPGRSIKSRVKLLRSISKDKTARFLREDLRQTVIAARLKDAGSHQLRPLVTQIEQELADLQSDFAGFQLQVTGDSALSIHRSQEMLGNLISSLLTAAVIIIGVIATTFRSIRVGLLSVIPNLLPIVSTAALLVLLGQPMQFSSLLAMTICLGVAVDDTIHFLRHVQQRLQSGDDLQTAVSRSQRELLPALATTTVLLLIGFGVAATSSMPMIRLFGILSCCSLVSAFIADLVLLPAMVLAIGGGGMTKSAEGFRLPTFHIAPMRATALGVIDSLSTAIDRLTCTPLKVLSRQWHRVSTPVLSPAGRRIALTMCLIAASASTPKKKSSNGNQARQQIATQRIIN